MAEWHKDEALYREYRRVHGRFADWNGFLSRTERLPTRVVELLSPLSATYPHQWRVMDVGCGPGAVAVPLGAFVHAVVGIEVNEHFIQFAEEYRRRRGVRNVFFVQANAEEFCAPARFDVVLMIDVLEHIRDRVKALQNAVLSLIPGGVFYVSTPNRIWPVEPHYRLVGLQFLPRGVQNAYIRAAGRPGYPSRLDPQEVHAAGIWLLTLRQLRTILNDLPVEYQLRYHPAAGRGLLSLLRRSASALLQAYPVLWGFFVGFHVVGKKVDG